MPQAKGKSQSQGQGYLHKGHRRRMFRKLRYGDSFTIFDHEILEVLLFFIIPRANTNPTAHELLFKFKTIYKVLKAPDDELLAVRGVGKESVTFLHLLGEVMDETDLFPTPLAVGRSRFELDSVLHARFYKEESGNYYIVSILLNGAVKSIVPIPDSTDIIEAGRMMFRMMVEPPCGVVIVHVRAKGHKFTDFDEDMIMTNFILMANLAYVKTFNYIVYDGGDVKYNYFNHPDKYRKFDKAIKTDLVKQLNEIDRIKQAKRAELKKKNFDYFEDTEGGGRYPKIGDVFKIKKDDE